MIKIFTDSSSNLPEKLTKKNKITVIPFSYSVNGSEENKFGEDFDGKAYYNALRSGKEVKTSMINIQTFSQFFEEELSAGNDVIYVGMSGGISGTASAAQIAAQELADKYPERKIEAIDSMGASLGEGMLVLDAAKMVKNKAQFDDVVKKIRDSIPNMCQCFTVDDLNYLKRTGRISGASAFIGGMLNIRPLLIGDNEGKIVVYDKIRGAKRALDALAERYAKLALDKATSIGIAHADNENGVKYLLSRLKEKGFCGDSLTVCYEPVTGSHVGPGTIALFFNGKCRVC